MIQLGAELHKLLVDSRGTQEVSQVDENELKE
jgi:hypothetical protein